MLWGTGLCCVGLCCVGLCCTGLCGTGLCGIGGRDVGARNAGAGDATSLARPVLLHHRADGSLVLTSCWRPAGRRRKDQVAGPLPAACLRV